MALTLSFDTSNYTTSVALFDSTTNTALHRRRLLPVKEGEQGLRQSDALFLHTAALGELTEALLQEAGQVCITRVAVSAAPRRVQGSYMPCFLAGLSCARATAAALQVPLIHLSHQEGHIGAGLFSADRMDLLTAGPFLALHLSGGTSELLEVQGESDGLRIDRLSSTLDISAGQLIDRVGVQMGMRFPCGRELDALSLNGKSPKKPRVSLKPEGFHLSGFENQAAQMLAGGEPPENVACYILDAIGDTLDALFERLSSAQQIMPLLLVGGVMANTLLRERFSRRNGTVFASTELSSDNAVGTAVLGAILEDRPHGATQLLGL